jgi:hypothetical protein
MSDFLIRVEHVGKNNQEILLNQKHQSQSPDRPKVHLLEWSEFIKELKDRSGKKWTVEVEADGVDNVNIFLKHA